MLGAGKGPAVPPAGFWFVTAAIFAVNAVIAVVLAPWGLALFLTLYALTAVFAGWTGVSVLRRHEAR